MAEALGQLGHGSVVALGKLNTCEAVHLGLTPFPKRNSRRGSSQAPQRHTRGPTYRCFPPDLAGFVSPCCVGPSSQHHST